MGYDYIDQAAGHGGWRAYGAIEAERERLLAEVRAWRPTLWSWFLGTSAAERKGT